MPAADLLAALRWWLVLTALGFLATPVTFLCLGRLADRGYAFTKMVGLLLVSFLFWLGGSLGFLGNSVGGILLAVAGVGLISGLAWRRAGETMRLWFRANLRQVALTELVFAAAFALWVMVRAQNPAIVATEKPMEFAFLNAVGVSPDFPPQDPWLSGFAISYYYFGYVMISVVARLAVVTESVAFNLGIAWLFAGTALGAFGLAYNLVRSEAGQRLAVTIGLVAALAVPLAGNLQILLETLHGNNVGSEAFWSWLDIRDINGPATDTPRYEGAGWWWWRSSRVINEYHLSGRDEEGLDPIAENPSFSFVLGDMHPHVLALPFAFLALAVALTWWQAAPGAPAPEGGLRRRARQLVNGIGRAPFWLAVLVLGGLSFLNTWDVLIHLFVMLGAYALARWRVNGAWNGSILRDTGTMAILLVVPAILLYLPFYLGFRSQAGAPYLLPFLMRPTRLVQFLVIFAVPLLPIVALLISGLTGMRVARWRSGLLAALGLPALLFVLLVLFGWFVALSPENSGRLTSLAAELGVSLTQPPDAGAGAQLGWSLTAVVAVVPALLRERLAFPWLRLFLAALFGLAAVVLPSALARRTDRPADSDTASSTPSSLPFVLLLIVTGILLTIGPEFLYLRDNFGQRLNTIFKFYYQAWVVFGVAGSFSLASLWQRSRALGTGVSAVYAVLLAVALTFPVRAVQSRQLEYGAEATLDGLAHVARTNPDEYEALRWLRLHAAPDATIVEAVGGQYSAYARVAASTGRPNVLGWAGHEYQWRGFSNPEPGEREPAVSQIYTDADWRTVESLLARYGVDYIYVGGLERATYGEQGMRKFAQNLEVAFQNGSVTIYRWSGPRSRS